MNPTEDTLQIKINEARSLLSKESREAIDNVNWKLTILGMNQKYTPEQLENLETETELLLCGILNPNDYPVELEKRMQISKEEVGTLINEMNKLVFKKIQIELEKIISKKNTNTQPTKTEIDRTALDPRFASLPMETQVAISKSNYQKNIYVIGEKYKLNIEQMGILEDITIQAMLNIIQGDKYEEILSSKVTISKEDVSNLVKDINELVFKKIRDEEMSSREGRETIKNEGITTNKIEEEVPLPPYAGTIKNEELGMRNEKEIIKPVQKITEIPKNMMENKLKGVTLSEHTISDYSTPKISSPETEGKPKSPDPYREAF